MEMLGNSDGLAGDGEATLPGRDPTREMYQDLSRAYAFFNERLFAGTLPGCLLTLRAQGRTLGYFSPERFMHPDGSLAHEIALNAEAFAHSSIEACMSTLVHEMVHLQQVVEGTAARRRYHNRDFADRMKRVGLIASTTGRPGGKQTGERMDHYIESGGPFETLLPELLTADFGARWADRMITVEPRPTLSFPDPGPGDRSTAGQPSVDTAASADHPHPDQPRGANSNAEPAIQDGQQPDQDQDDLPTLPAPGGQVAPSGALPEEPDSPYSRPLAMASPDRFVTPSRAAKRASKTRYTCPQCRANVWGKPGLEITCTPCDVYFRTGNELALLP
jgi:hypothetical protein